ncbi:MAG: 7TM diverse intracellular signaling domain-containing protein [Bacteroidota bacterium]
MGDQLIHILKDDTERRIPFESIQVFVDSSAQLTFEQVISPAYHTRFQSNIFHSESPSLAYWLRFSLYGQALKEKSWFLEGRDPNTHYMDVYLPAAEGGFRQLRMGLLRDHHARPIPHKNFITELPTHLDTVTVYVRVLSPDRNQFLFRLKSASFFTRYSHNEYVLLGVFYGIMLIMAVYNLLLFFIVKEKLYVWYVFYVLSSMLICLSEDGLGFQYIWYAFPGFNLYVESIAGILFLFCFLFYSNRFIEYAKHLPRYTRLIGIASILAIIAILFRSSLPGHVSVSGIYPIPVSLVFIAALLILRRGYPPARAFVLALSFVMGSILLLFLNKINAFDWISMNNLHIVLMVYAFNIALIFEVVIFSFGQGQKLLYFQKKQQQILTASELRFRGIFDTSFDAIIVYDFGERTFVNINERSLELFQYNREDFTHIHLTDLFQDKNGKNLLVLDPDQQQLQKQAFFLGEIKGVRKGKEIFDCEMTIAPLQERDETFVVIAIKDISRQKQAERDLENRLKEIEEKNNTLKKYISSNSELQSFAYVASHDMKQPIRTIKGFSQLIQKKLNQAASTDPDIHEYLDFIISGSSTLESLIHDLLEHSKVNQIGKFDFAIESLNDILERVQLNLNEQIKESGVEIIRGDLPPLYVERNRMLQLFQNLLSNAIKFRRADIPCQIKIASKELAQHWQISIEDNGIGIPADKQEEVFEIFKKLHNKDKYPGHGIGLATCKKIVDIHHGEIWLESEEGVGTTFYLTIDKDLQNKAAHPISDSAHSVT